MNIMKTNMLLLENNKILKEDTGNTTVEAPVPATKEPQAGMNALSFLGMKNLMANPKLAMGVGVMNDKMAEMSSADSYVAPYSSNIAFQGKFGNVSYTAEKTAKKAVNKISQALPASLIALSALLPSALALTSCDKDINVSQSTTVIVDMTAMVAAIDALRAEIEANSKADAEQQKAILEALRQALAVLMQMQAQMEAQSLTMENFKELMLGKTSAIIEAIMTLQNINESSARAIIATIVEAFEKGDINFQQAMAQIIALLTQNNELLESILSEVQNGLKAQQEYMDSLLNIANEINKNGKASLIQQQMMLAQNNALIMQNNVLIAQGQKLLQKADELNMSVQQLSVIAQFIGKSIEDVIKMSKDEIIAAINAKNIDLENLNNILNNINNGITNNTMTIEEAANLILSLLGDVNQNLDDIKAMLKQHFEKYDIDMEKLLSIVIDTNKDVKEIKNDVKNFAATANSMSVDIKNMSEYLRDIRLKLQNGITIDNSQLEELLKRIHATQEMSTEEILKRLDAYLEKMDAQADKLDNIYNQLTKLGYVVSNDVINAINNIGDDLQGLDAIADKLDELIAAVQVLTKSFDLYAKNALKAHEDEIDLLNEIKDALGDVDAIKNQIDVLIQKANNAEEQRNNLEEYLKALLNKAKDIEDKLGRIPTVEEFDIMLSKHDAANQEFYANLIKEAGLNPADFSNIEELLKAIKEALGDFQKTTNALLADILAKLDAMDKNAPDYNEKLDQIIELMKNFKFECNCKCDCDHNTTIHEGVIDIIS